MTNERLSVRAVIAICAAMGAGAGAAACVGTTNDPMHGGDDASGGPSGAEEAGAATEEAGSAADGMPRSSDAGLSLDAPVSPPVDDGSCSPRFASGVNVAWVRFANDIPAPNLAMFQTLFENTHAAGGRVARWWFHTNGTRTPGYDANNVAIPISTSNIADVRSILDTAHAAGMMLTISLWSFDMLKGTVPAATLAANKSLLTVDANRQAYIDNVLTPLVTALRGHPALFAWETFNEPEGMASGGIGWRPFTGTRLADGGVIAGESVDETFIQKTVNWFAAAIHDADPSARVTNGTWEFQANSNAPGMTNYYSDSALRAAGGKANGTLDFYEVHYYPADTAKFSPFANPASYWGLDKPIVIGEFYAIAQDGVAAADTYTALHTGGYGGAWSWQYLHNDGTNASNGGQSTMWPAMQAPLQNLYAATPSDVDCP